MSKLKINNQEYAIRLVFPEVGDFYLSRIESKWNCCNYLFTSKLSKAQKWKTKNKIEEILIHISESEDSIFLLLDSDTDLPPKYKDLIICSMKKYRFLIKKITTKDNIDKIRSNIDGLDLVLLEDSNIITNLIQNANIDNDTLRFLKKFKIDIQLYRKLNGYLSFFDDDKYIEVVDASYGFRRLKMIKLNETSEYHERTKSN